jgi:AbrB family looped-hinge helix DNA binding protein
MALAHSKVTAQGQISVPAEVRRRLGIGPGAVLEWEEEGGQIVVRKAGRYSSQEVHQAVFGTEAPAIRTVAEMDEGIRRHLKARRQRDR